MLKVLTVSFCIVIVALLVITSAGYAFRDNIMGAWLMDEGSGKVVRDVTGNHGESEIMVCATRRRMQCVNNAIN